VWPMWQNPSSMIKALSTPLREGELRAIDARAALWVCEDVRTRYTRVVVCGLGDDLVHVVNASSVMGAPSTPFARVRCAPSILVSHRVCELRCDH